MAYSNPATPHPHHKGMMPLGDLCGTDSLTDDMFVLIEQMKHQRRYDSFRGSRTGQKGAAQ